MNKYFCLLFSLFLISSCTDNSGNYPVSELEKSVVQRAYDKPETAYDYFMGKIEGGATADEQAVYMYGIAVAREKLGDTKEAINDYLVAEGLGNKSAAKALDRLHVKRDQ